MNKKQYIKPEIEVVLLQQQCQLLAGSDLTKYDDPTLVW